MKDKPKRKKKKDEDRITVVVPPEGGTFSINLMTGIVKQIFDYNPKNDPKDPLYKKDKEDDNNN